MRFRKNHLKRVVGDTAMRAKPWDNTKAHAANTEALGRATGWSRTGEYWVGSGEKATAAVGPGRAFTPGAGNVNTGIIPDQDNGIQGITRKDQGLINLYSKGDDLVMSEDYLDKAVKNKRKEAK